MGEYKWRWACLLVLLACAAAAAESVGAPAQRNYRDRANNYSFDYPVGYRLRTEQDFFELSRDRKAVLYGRVSEIIATDENGEQVEYKNTREEFIKYARQHAKNLCAADGAGESLYCPGVNKESVFDVGEGLTAVELYLNHIYERNGRKTRSVYGPVYVVNLSMAGKPRTLLVEPATQGGARRSAAPAVQQLMRALVESVRTGAP
jgi:hypothetical protein